MQPASHVITKCGGVEAVMKLTGRSRSAIHRWTYPAERGGLDGRVPFRAACELLQAAQEGRCDLAPEDFFFGAVTFNHKEPHHE